ncbi:MAG: hypothetical protein H6766_01915 [Candidatus Peribacteria bacterium]|nr:MAG: hypothetical protein H6766_01915 [Candidatus Peribacteria bacterium]
MSVFFSLEYKEVFVFLVKFSPQEYRPIIYQKMLTIYDKMQLWLKGQLFLMIYIFSVTLL